MIPMPAGRARCRRAVDMRKHVQKVNLSWCVPVKACQGPHHTCAYSGSARVAALKRFVTARGPARALPLYAGNRRSPKKYGQAEMCHDSGHRCPAARVPGARRAPVNRFGTPQPAPRWSAFGVPVCKWRTKISSWPFGPAGHLGNARAALGRHSIELAVSRDKPGCVEARTRRRDSGLRCGRCRTGSSSKNAGHLFFYQGAMHSRPFPQTPDRRRRTARQRRLLHLQECHWQPLAHPRPWHVRLPRWSDQNAP